MAVDPRVYVRRLVGYMHHISAVTETTARPLPIVHLVSATDRKDLLAVAHCLAAITRAASCSGDLDNMDHIGTANTSDMSDLREFMPNIERLGLHDLDDQRLMGKLRAWRGERQTEAESVPDDDVADDDPFA